MPSHVFVPMHVGLSSTPAPTLEHMPTLPVTLQAWQVVMHDELQQTPSTQKLLKQAPVPLHATPTSSSQSFRALHDCVVPEQPVSS